MNRDNRTDKKGKTPLAAALKYDGNTDAAPRVTAKGQGGVAGRIIEQALLHGVPVKEDSALVEFLYRLDVDEEVPVELYRAIAEILTFVYSLDERKRDLQ